MPFLIDKSGSKRRVFWKKSPGSAGVLMLSALLALGSSTDLRPQGPPATEYEVKAAFLVNFTRFVEWPASSFPDAAAPLIIGILGDDPFGASLDQMVAGKQVLGRPLVVRRWEKIDQVENCQLLFVSAAADAGLVSEAVEQFRRAPVLTVSDADQFNNEGGMIRLVLVENKIRFEINNRTAREAKLKISSRLLSLALRVWE